MIQSFEIRYTFRVWICYGCCGFILWECPTCPLFSGSLRLCFTTFLVSYRVCRHFKIWIHSVVWLRKRDKSYKAQAHCLTYMFTGLHEMYYPWRLPFDLMIPYWWQRSAVWENSCLYITRAEQLGYLTVLIIHWNWCVKTI